MKQMQKKMTPGTQEHEVAVKKMLQEQIQVLQNLEVLEARQIEIGNSFLAFRFNTPAIEGTQHK